MTGERRGSDADHHRRPGTGRRRVLRTLAAGVAGVRVVPGRVRAGGDPEPDVRLGARVDGWVGVEPESIAAETNPTLRFVEGREYAVEWENLDGAPHELVFLDAAGEVVARSERRAERGARVAASPPRHEEVGAADLQADVTVTATPDLARYACAVHPESMTGPVVVGDERTVEYDGLTASATGPPPLDEAFEDEQSELSAAFVFEADGTMDWRLELSNLDGVTQVAVREASLAAVGPVLVPLVEFAASPDGRAGGEPRDVPEEPPLVRWGVVEDTDAVDALGASPEDYYLAVHTVDVPEGQLTAGFTPIPALELFSVRVENVADESLSVPGGGAEPVTLSPGVYAVYEADDEDGLDDVTLFVPGRPEQGRGLESLAEDGDPGPLADAVFGRAEETGTFGTPVGASGRAPVRPGEAYEFTFAAVPGQRLALALSLLGANDWFYATEIPIPLFDASETPFDGDATGYVSLWDAGTGVAESSDGGTTPSPGAGRNVSPDADSDGSPVPFTPVPSTPEQSAPDTHPDDRDPIRAVPEGRGPGAFPPTDAVLRVTVRPSITADGH